MIWFSIAMVSTYTILIPIGGLLVFRKDFIGRKALSIFIVMSFFFETFFLITSTSSIRNLPFFHLYTLSEFVLLSIFFRAISGYKGIGFNILILVGSLYLIINPFLFESLKNYNAISRTVVSIAMVFFCIQFYYKIYKEEEVINLDRYPVFWIVSGLMVYLTLGLFTHLMANYILEGESDKITMMFNYSFANIGNIIKNVMIFIGLWKSNR
jgi:hypothetical protein